MKIKNLFVAVLAAVVGFPPAAVRFVKNIGRQTVLACNAFTPSVHRNSITKFTSAAITTRYLLGKFDSANLTNGVAVAGLGDRAFFVIADTAATATDLALTTPAPVNCLMLDSINETVPMVAAGAIAVGTVKILRHLTPTLGCAIINPVPPYVLVPEKVPRAGRREF